MAASHWQGEDQDFDPFDDLLLAESDHLAEEYAFFLREPPPETTQAACAVVLPVDELASQQAWAVFQSTIANSVHFQGSLVGMLYSDILDFKFAMYLFAYVAPVYLGFRLL